MLGFFKLFGFSKLFSYKKMENQNKEQRPIDQIVSKASRSLTSRFVIASKMEIKTWKAFLIVAFAAGFFAALIWGAHNKWYIESEAAKKKSKEATQEEPQIDKKLIEKYHDFPMHGSAGIIGAGFGETDRDTISDGKKLDEAIKIHKKYNINTISVLFSLLADKGKCTASACALSEEGGDFLKKVEDNDIRLQISFNTGKGFEDDGESLEDDKAFSEHLSKVREFLKDLNVFREENKKAYDNILTFFVGDDVGEKRKERVISLARYIRSEIYSKSGGGLAGRALDVHLSADTNGWPQTGKELAKYIEIVGGYDYPLLTHGGLRAFLKRYQKESGISAERTFTFTQTQSQYAYNALGFDSASDKKETKAVENPYPEGIQTASLIFHNLRAGVNHFLLYDHRYMESGESDKNMSLDRLAEAGLVSKLIDAIWDSILKDASPNEKIRGFSDEEGKFLGDAFKFKDTKNGKAALLVVNAGIKPNHIAGKAWGTNVRFERFMDENGKRKSLTLEDLGLGANPQNLRAYQIEFPGLQEATMSFSNGLVSINASQINENALILLTTDKRMADRINSKLKSYSSDSKNLLCEALEGRVAKTEKKLSDVQKAGGKVPDEYLRFLKPILESADDCQKMNHREIRTRVSQIGDSQVDIYNHFRGIENHKNVKKPYPDFAEYSKAYWKNPEEYKSKFVPQKKEICEAQRLNFYLLDEYINWDCRSKEQGGMNLSRESGEEGNSNSADSGEQNAAGDE